MIKIRDVIAVGLIAAASATPAVAAHKKHLARLHRPAVQRELGYVPHQRVYGSFGGPSYVHDEGYCYTDESCKAPHNGFDPHGNGVHPPIGPITD